MPWVPRTYPKPNVVITEFRKFALLADLPTEGKFEEVVYVIENHSFYVYSSGSWQAVGGSGGSGAPTTATYIVKTADAGLSNEFALSTLSTGLLKVTTTTGALTTAVAGTDYLSPSGSGASLTALNADALASGTVSTARLSGVAILASANAFTHGQSITAASGEVGLLVQAAANANALNINSSASVLTSSFDKDGYGFVVERVFLLAVGTPATTGTNKTNQVTMTRSGKFLKAFINAKTAPTGADLIIDINRNGTSIWASTQANRLKLVASATTGNQTSFDTVNFVEGDVVTIDIDQVGSTIAGTDVTVQLVTLCRNGAA